MKKKVAIVVIPSGETQAPSNFAALTISLARLPWKGWLPSLHVLSDAKSYGETIRNWWPFAGEVINNLQPTDLPGPQVRDISLLKGWKRLDADVYLVLGERILAAGPFEDVLDDLILSPGIAGVLAYSSFPAWPGLNHKEAWQRLTTGLLGKPLAFDYFFSLRTTAVGPERHRIPYYINSEVLFISGDWFDAVVNEWANSALGLRDRIPIPAFLDSVALTVAAGRLNVPRRPLPLRYNLPNDPAVAAIAPDELNDARLLHFHRTDTISADVFASKLGYETFMEGHYDGVNEVFRQTAAAIFGRTYPFDGTQCAESHNGASDSTTSLAASRAVAAEPSVTGCRHFDYSSGQPNLYLLMRFKQALVAEFGVAEGFRKYQRIAHAAASDLLATKSVVRERDFAQTQALVFHEVAPTGEVFCHHPPSVIGEGNHTPIVGRSRSLYVACLPNVTVRGRSAVIETQHAAILDFQDDEAAQLDDEIDWDPAIFHANGAQAWVTSPTSIGSDIEIETAFMLVGVHSDFFGHWISEYLAKFTAAVLSGAMPRTPVLIDAHMPASHRQSLELLFEGEFEIIELQAFQRVRVRRLWCAPSLMYMPLHEERNEKFDWGLIASPPQIFANVVREWTRRADRALPPVEGPRRVYLARKSFRHRKLVNAREIEDAARIAGFTVIYPEDLSFAEQVAACRNANHIVAPEGSALFLVFFSRPGTKLCILSHPLTDALVEYNGHFNQQGIEVVALTGPFTQMASEVSHDSDYSIDTAKFGTFLQDWLDG